MNQREINLALTRAAQNIAESEGLPLRRQVRYVNGIRHDLEIREDDHYIFVSSEISVPQAARALKRGVRYAASVDFAG